MKCWSWLSGRVGELVNGRRSKLGRISERMARINVGCTCDLVSVQGDIQVTGANIRLEGSLDRGSFTTAPRMRQDEDRGRSYMRLLRYLSGLVNEFKLVKEQKKTESVILDAEKAFSRTRESLKGEDEWLWCKDEKDVLGYKS